MLCYIYCGGLQNGNPFWGVWRELWVKGGLKEAFISAEILGCVFSVVSCTYLQRWSEHLILSMHCRADSHACGILVYEILQIEIYELLRIGVSGFFLYQFRACRTNQVFYRAVRHIPLWVYLFTCGGRHAFPLWKGRSNGRVFSPPHMEE